MPDESMRERLARALCGADGDGRLSGWRAYLQDADAALRALREPTAAMLAAGANYRGNPGSLGAAQGCFQAMIDAALVDADDRPAA